MNGSNDGSKTRGVNRRSVLTALSMAGFSATVPGVVSANKNERVELVGISYDPYTHQSQREASATLMHGSNGISGVLNVGGMKIPIGNDSPISPAPEQSVPTYTVNKSGEKFRSDDNPLNIWFKERETSIIGYMTRPSIKYDKLAFSLGVSEDGVTPEKMKNGLYGGGSGAPGHPKRDLPKQGIPQRMTEKRGGE